MATYIAFHAHPDDEAIGTGGVMAKAAAEGHRVVLVVATRGEHGLVPEGISGPGEALAELRTKEVQKSAEILGVSRVAFLDYWDSGMAGDELNNQPECFWQADVDEAAKKLAAILDEESADVISFYDENGVYGHPDHIQVHRVGMRATQMVGVPHVYMSTNDRSRTAAFFEDLRDSGLPFPGGGGDRPIEIGVESERITTRVNVEDFYDVKRAAMSAHESQIFENSFFLGLPRELSTKIWGVEHFIRVGAPEGYVSDDLFSEL